MVIVVAASLNVDASAVEQTDDGPDIKADGEVPVEPDLEFFEACRSAIRPLTLKRQLMVELPTYHMSVKWGLVMRADLVPQCEFASEKVVRKFICWNATGRGLRVKIVVDDAS